MSDNEESLYDAAFEDFIERIKTVAMLYPKIRIRIGSSRLNQLTHRKEAKHWQWALGLNSETPFTMIIGEQIPWLQFMGLPCVIDWMNQDALSVEGMIEGYWCVVEQNYPLTKKEPDLVILSEDGQVIKRVYHFSPVGNENNVPVVVQISVGVGLPFPVLEAASRGVVVLDIDHMVATIRKPADFAYMNHGDLVALAKMSSEIRGLLEPRGWEVRG
jgi:uncharacterized protein YqcC (DUF446 family)